MAAETFTQEQLNSHIKTAKDEATAKVFADLGFKDAKEVSDFKIAKATADDTLASLQGEIDGYKLKDLKINKALEHGLSIDNLDLITGKSEEEIEGQAKKLSEFIKQQTPDPDKPNPEAPTKPKTDFGDALSGILGGDK